MFAGISGFRSGLEKAGGYECIGFCEIDKHAESAYRAMYDTRNEVFFNDARQIDTDKLADFDLLVAGFPCQPFSTSGRHFGFSDTRGTLFFEAARVIKAKRPKVFILENVPGLLSHDKGKTFGVILETLSELGYSFQWMVHNSAHFGVPQQRRRVYVVGYSGNECPVSIFPLARGNGENLKELIGGPQGQRVYDTDGAAVTQCAGSGGWGGKTGLYFIDMNPDPRLTDNARCILARYDSGITNHKGISSGVFIESDKSCAVLNPAKEKICQNGREKINPDESMSTLAVQDRNGILRNGRIRKLMPIECWRLQGFTDEQFNKVKALGICDGQLYKMAGNAVSVPVITEIGKALKQIFDEKEEADDTN